jgi:hypothetical protein
VYRLCGLSDDEVAAVEAAVRRHPKSRKYRVNVKHNRIEVYEMVGPDADELVAALVEEGLASAALADRLRPMKDSRNC